MISPNMAMYKLSSLVGSQRNLRLWPIVHRHLSHNTSGVFVCHDRGAFIFIDKYKSTFAQIGSKLCLPKPSVIIYKRDSSSNRDNNDGKKNNNGDTAQIIILLVSFGFGYMMFRSLSDSLSNKRMNGNNNSVQPVISWNEFVKDILPTGEVKSISTLPFSKHSILVHLHDGATIKGQQISVLSVRNIPNVENVLKMLKEEETHLGIDPAHGIKIHNLNFSRALFSFGIIVAGIALLVFSFRTVRNRAKDFSSMMENMTKQLGPSDAKLRQRTGVKFADVAGMTEAKQEVMEFVHFLKNPEKYEKLGGKMPKGCLLTGPPGVGKTLLAKAVASESDVPFLIKSGSDFVEMIGGLGAKRVRELFAQARDESPCIIYIDEIDAVGAKRDSDPTSAGGEYAQTLNQLLVEMDGMLSSKQQIVVMASTNRPDKLDPALLRPGRFDRHIYIDLPNMIERQEIFEKHLKKYKIAKDVTEYVGKLARLTPGMSGASIANVCNEAAIFAARKKDEYIDDIHFEYAVERTIAGSPKKFSPLQPEERLVVSVHESGHALVGWLLEHTDVLMKVSIIPHTKAALGYSQLEAIDRKLLYKEQLFERMCMALGGHAAESIYFNKVTSGAEDDIKKVTDMAYAYVKHLGFSSKIGHLSFKDQEDNPYVKPYSDNLQKIMDEEARVLVYKAYNQTKKLLNDNKQKLEIVSKNLFDKELLNYSDIENLIGPPIYGDKKKVVSVPIGPLASDLENET